MFTKVGFTPFANGTVGWIAPECLVVGPTIVVAGETEEAGEGQDDKGG